MTIPPISLRHICRRRTNSSGTKPAKREFRIGNKTHIGTWIIFTTILSNLVITTPAFSQTKDSPLIYFIMAVSSMGKTTQGEKLAKFLSVPFYEPDDYHPDSNKKKIAAGQELTDDDRGPWLDRLKKEVIDKHLKENKPAVMACSALKRKYRERLGLPNPKVQLIYLKGSLKQALANNRKRKNHFAGEQTVHNNFKVLEEPTAEEKAVVVDVHPDDIEITFRRMLGALNLRE